MALKDKMTLTIEEVKLFLHIDHDAEDVVLQRMLSAAANAAERYLNHDFGDDPVPEEVEIWIMNRVARQFQRRGEGLHHEILRVILKFGMQRNIETYGHTGRIRGCS